MGALILVIGAGLVVLLWVQGTRRNRLRWLRKLDLPGVWHCEQSKFTQEGRMEFSGELHCGQYRIVDPELEERGRWELDGHRLLLTPDADSDLLIYELRFFDDGKIGIDGPGRERRVYTKERSNVVPLRRRS